MSKKKYSKEFKLARIKDHLDKGISFYKLEKEHAIELGSIRRWYEAYKVQGESALEPHDTNVQYTAEFKQQVVKEYLAGKGSYVDLAVRYGIHANTTICKWVKQYNSHEELTDSRPERGRCLMAKGIKGRSTTLEERIKIVEHCIANSNNYGLTASEFKCSYGQVYSWVKKYQEKGVDGLKDGRGRNKPNDEMSEVEKIRAENRLLRAEMKKQQMEIDLLKKLEDIGRR